MQPKGSLIAVWLAACCIGAPAGARAEDAADPKRVIVTEGSAPVLAGDVAAARQAAIQQAMRDAIQRTVGVAISATLRTRNYAVAEDRIITHARGFAVLEEVVEERQEAGSYRVRARVAVRLKPLMREIAEAFPDRAPRALVVIASSTLYGSVPFVAREAQVTAAQCLAEAGIEARPWIPEAGSPADEELRRVAAATPSEVAAWGRSRGVDIVVAGRLSSRVGPGIALPRDWVGVDYSRSTAEIAARAVRCDTGEVLCEERFAGSGDGVSARDAVGWATRQASQRAGRRIGEALRLLPGVATREVSLRINGLSRIAEAAEVEEALRMLPGVRRVTRQVYAGGILLLDMSVAMAVAGDLPALIEDCLALGGRPLAITRVCAARIEAMVIPADAD